MNLTKTVCPLFFAITSIYTNAYASFITADKHTATLSVKEIIMPGTSQSGPVTCHSSLANCLVTLKWSTSTEGWIVLLNNSRYPAYNVTASLPAAWANTVVQTTFCNYEIPVQGSCTLKFKAIYSQNFSKETIPVKGSNTNTVYFDMEVTP